MKKKKATKQTATKYTCPRCLICQVDLAFSFLILKKNLSSVVIGRNFCVITNIQS